MKDLRGLHAAAVRTGILKEFGLNVSSNKLKNIPEWKKSAKVKECFGKLYDDDENAIENITRYAFPQVSPEDDKFNNIYVYTAAICDIVLNPNYPDVECSKKPLQRRYQKFKVCIFD
jgi:hypothetical protein